MRALIASVAILALAACGQSAPPNVEPNEAASAQDLALTCTNFSNLTPETLAERFGAENISTQTLPGAEGETYEATVVFANDPVRRLAVVWNDARTAPASFGVDSAGTQWRGAEGFTIGTPISDVERMNVMPFKLWGFGWDYGGWVSDWAVGTLSPANGCMTRVRFSPRNDANSAQGDGEFASNDPAVRAADPIVSEFGLVIVQPQ